MIDWLKYLPLALRHFYTSITPKDPYFQKPKEFSWNFGDNQLSIMAPKHNPVLGPTPTVDRQKIFHQAKKIF